MIASILSFVPYHPGVFVGQLVSAMNATVTGSNNAKKMYMYSAVSKLYMFHAQLSYTDKAHPLFLYMCSKPISNVSFGLWRSSTPHGLEPLRCIQIASNSVHTQRRPVAVQWI